MRSLAALAFALPLAAQPAADFPEDMVKMEVGSQLDASHAKECEAALLTNPDGRTEHLELLGYYNAHRDPGWQDGAVQHTLWLIAHEPALTATRNASQVRPLPRLQRERIGRAWEDAVARNGDTPAVLKNAATFWSMVDPPRAVDLWKKVVSLDPDCSTCRGAWQGLRPDEALGTAYAWMIYGVGDSDEHGRPVFLPPSEQTKRWSTEARKSLEESRDARVLLVAGGALHGTSSFFQTQTGRDPAELAALGNALQDRGNAIDPALGKLYGARASHATVPSAPPSPPAAVMRIIVEPAKQASLLVKRVPPSYPPLARQARLAGSVRLQIIVGTDGAVLSAALLRGHPQLVEAARFAVLQWVYRPTMVDGQPVQVQTTVDVEFVPE